MKKNLSIIVVLIAFMVTGCATAYKAAPISFKAPSAYPNMVAVGSVHVQIAAKAYVDNTEALQAFGFDVRAAGMLPIQVIIDNQGKSPLEMNAGTALLEDAEGNLWPILNQTMAYERATKFSRTKQVFKSGAYKGLLGAAAGAVIGAAVGIVTGENVLAAAGKGTAVGGAAGAAIGGAEGLNDDRARQSITADLRAKSLENKEITPGALAYGVLFFPGEAQSATKLRIQLIEKGTGTVHSLMFDL